MSRISGAHLNLPSYEAMAVALFVHEWFAAALDDAACNPREAIHIAFQQLGRDVIVQIENSPAWHGRQILVNRDIIALVASILQGNVTETTEGEVHRVRLRFSLPAGE
jgi:hypothetical protein